MKQYKKGLTILFAVFSLNICNAQKLPTSVVSDFNQLVGSWKGALTYLDYSSGKPYTMPADITIKQLDKTNSFVFYNIYPNETSANSIDTISLSADGKYIDKALIKSRRKLKNGDIEIVAEEKGKDGNDNRNATFRHTYFIGKTHYSKKKEVQFEGETNWIKRHEYAYTRKPSR
jgi:hypothetical protein